MKEELSNEDFKKLQRIQKRLKRCADEITSMGFNVYLNSGTLCILNGPTHENNSNSAAIRENEVFSMCGFNNWDGGDW